MRSTRARQMSIVLCVALVAAAAATSASASSAACEAGPSGPAGVLPPADWTAEGGQTSWFGQSVAGAGDVNGDGYADVIVGAPIYGTGRAYLYLGSATGLGTTAAWIAEGPGDLAYGWSVSTAGDVNGDGFADVIIGNDQYSEGNVYVYLGSAEGLASSPAWTAASQDAFDFGRVVSSAGDVNGDGYSDVLVGAPDMNFEGTGGEAYVYLGSASGPSASPAWVARGTEGTRFGEAVGTAGDVNGDGYSDVIVGAPEDGAKGRASLYLGSATGLASTAAWTAQGDWDTQGMGIAVAAGDVNGDGYSDVILGAFWHVYVYLGSVFGTREHARLVEEGDLGSFGEALGTGDVNGDGYSDVIVGDRQEGTGQEGRVHVWLGSPTGLSDAESWTASGDSVLGTWFGRSVAGAGDVDRDGYSDVLVGAPNYGDPMWEGMAFAYHGPLVEVSFGGSATGITPQAVRCDNRSTSERVVEKTSAPSWSCEELGLAVSAGDRVQTSMRGAVTGSSSVRASITRMTPSVLFCQNVTTGAEVRIASSDTSWDCGAMGLVVSAGDVLVTGATGHVR